MPATLEKPDAIGVDRAKGHDLTAYTFICGDCGRTEHRPIPTIPDGWDLIELDCSGAPFLRCPDCNEAIEQNKIAEFWRNAPKLRKAARAGKEPPAAPPETQAVPDAPRPFSVFLEKQDCGKYLIAMAPEKVLMRWHPLGFFLTPAEAHALADELRTFALLAARPGEFPAKGEKE